MITEEDFIRAGLELMREKNGPVISFSFNGELFGTTYCLSDDDEDDREIFDSCMKRFLFYLNKKMKKESMQRELFECQTPIG